MYVLARVDDRARDLSLRQRRQEEIATILESGEAIGKAKQGGDGMEGNNGPALLQSFEEAFDAIRSQWLERVRRHCLELSGDAKMADVPDLPTLLRIHLSQKTRGGLQNDVASPVDHLVGRVRRRDYSISDLSHEVDHLKEVMADVLPKVAGVDDAAAVRTVIEACRALDGLFEACLVRTSAIHEAVLEGGARGYCEIGRSGLITYANAALHNLTGMTDCRGRRISDFFGQEERFVNEALAGKQGPHSVLRRMWMSFPDGRRVPVNAEFGPLVIDGETRGAYAVISNVSSLLKAEYRAFDASPSGVVRVDNEQRLVFVNKKAATCFGIDKVDLEGMSLWDLFTEKKAKEILSEELKRRREGAGSFYELPYRRKTDGRVISVQINAMPEFDNLGEQTGSLAIIESLELREAIDQSETWRDLLDRLFEVVRRDGIPFDLGIISVYSEDMTFARPVHFYPEPEPMWENLWFPISLEFRQMAVSMPSYRWADLQEMPRQQRGAEYLAENTTFQRLVNEGYRGLLVFFIRERGKAIGTFTLVSFEEDIYQPEHEAALRALGIESLVKVALLKRREEEHAFLHDLHRQIARQCDIKAVVKLLVRRLAAFYDWQNVAIIKVNRIHRRFELLAQGKGKHGGFSIRGDFSQPIGQGILGRTYRSGKTQNVSDVRKDRDYCASNTVTSSELCVPIRVLGQINWLLNLEDRRKDAFAAPEQRTLERVVEEIEATLERLFDSLILEQMVEVASDGVIWTDARGKILRCNRAAERMLECDEATARKSRISAFIHNGGIAEEVASGNKIYRRHVSLNGMKGKQTGVVISGGDLPEEYNRRVLFLEDVDTREWQGDLKALGSALKEVAAQTRVPLSLAAGLLRRMVRQAEATDLGRRIDDVIRQLHKVEITYDRVFFAYDHERDPRRHFVRVWPGRILSEAIDALPEEERKQIRLCVALDLPPSLGDAYQLAFVFQSIVNYLLRGLALEEWIDVAATAGDGVVAFRIAGPAPAEAGGPNDALRQIEEEVRARIALGEGLIRKIVQERHGGLYQEPARRDGRLIFEFTLPVAEGGVKWDAKSPEKRADHV